MKARLAAALTTSALLAVAGCSGGGSDDAGAPSTTSSAGSSVSTTGPTGAASSSAAPSATASSRTVIASPTTSAPRGAVGPEQADREATRVLTAMNQAEGRRGKRADRARRAAWTGVGLRAAKGDAKVAKARGGSSSDEVFAPVRPTVLAVSRGAERPAYLVVQTEPDDSETPVVHLMRSGKKGSTFHIEESAAMLPGTSILPFDAVETGSATATAGRSGKESRSVVRGLAVRPKKLLAAYSRYLHYPRKKVKDRPFADDHFADSVRAGARQQAHAVRTQADFGQSHRVLPDSVVTVQQQNGGALVFAALERHDDFDIKSGQTVKPTKAFQVFAPDQQKIEISARLTTIEFVVFQVPATSGRATLIAASEHLVGGKGH